MKKLLAFILFAGLVGVPAFGDSVTGLIGWVQPRGDSDVFQQNEFETTFRVNDLDNIGGTFRYDHFLGNFVNISGGFSFYEDTTTVRDVDFVHEDGTSIIRDIHMEIAPIEASVHVLPIGRNAGVIPYVGGGFGLYYWRYEEVGDFIMDRNTANPTVVFGSAFSDGWDPGWHVEGGVHIPVSRSFAVVGEAKYWQVHGDLDLFSFDPSFEPLDLSGMQFSGGFSVWF